MQFQCYLSEHSTIARWYRISGRFRNPFQQKENSYYLFYAVASFAGSLFLRSWLYRRGIVQLSELIFEPLIGHICVIDTESRSILERLSPAVT